MLEGFKKNDHLDFVAYTNSDWAGDRDNRKSGYMEKQKVVTLSSAKAEFNGIAKGRTEIIWIQNLLLELHFLQKKACKFINDNKAAINISGNPVQHDLTKQVKINRHFIKEKLEKKIIRIPFVRSKDQLTNILMKVVTLEAFELRYW